ncbi:MAG: DUF3501 family protein [Acidimicrobiales bacterium]
MTARTELTVADILDLRAYERVRQSFRQEVMAKKRRRRVPVGPIMTLLFESEETVRFQIQEMARVERIVTDGGIQAELDIYNKLLPVPGELSATLFVELTTEPDLRHWLPLLVGIERSVVIEPGTPPPATAGGPAMAVGAVHGVPEAAHAESLTRESVTPAVHYLRFPFTVEQIGWFAAGPVSVAVRHPEYQAGTELSEETRRELLADLEGRTEPPTAAR